MSKFKLVYNATSGEADEVKAILHASDALASTSNALHVLLQNASIAVTATDLDIRDLTQTDEVTVFQGTSPWVVSATQLDIDDLDFATDSVDVSGSSVSISGVVSTAPAVPATIDSLSKAVTTSSALLFTAPADMKEVKVQNNGSVAIAVGPSGVTYSGTPATDGYIIAPGDAESFVMATGAVLHAVAKSGTQDVRVFTLAT